jgi:hypothetical protein
MIWKSAKAWGYVGTNPFDGLVLPRNSKRQAFIFTCEDVLKKKNCRLSRSRKILLLACG